MPRLTIISSLFSPLRSIRSPTNKLIILRVLNILTLLTFISYSVYSIVISQPSSIDICDKYPTYLTPPLIFIGIFWSILFLLQFVFVSYSQFNDFNLVQRVVENYVDWLFSLSNLFMCGWLFFWLRESFILAGVSALFTLIFTSMAQHYLIAKYIPNHDLMPTSVISSIHIPFSMYSAFSFFLLFHNGFIYLSQQGYEQDVNWAIVSASILTVYSILWSTTGVFSKGKRDFTFSLTIIWLLLGLSIQQSETDLLSNTYVLLALIQIIVISVIIFKNCSKSNKAQAGTGERERLLYKNRVNFYGGIIVDNWFKAPINDDHPSEV